MSRSALLALALALPAQAAPPLPELLKELFRYKGRSVRPRIPRRAVERRQADKLMGRMRAAAAAMSTPLDGGPIAPSLGRRPSPPAGRQGPRVPLPLRYLRPETRVPGPERKPPALRQARLADRLTATGRDRLRSARAEEEEGWAGVRKFGQEALGYAALAAGHVVEQAPGWLAGAARWAAQRAAPEPRRALVDPAADLRALRRGAELTARDAAAVGKAAAAMAGGVADDFKRAGGAWKSFGAAPNSYHGLAALAFTGVALMDANPAGWGKSAVAKTVSKGALLKVPDELFHTAQILRSPDFSVIKAMDGFPSQRSALIAELVRRRVPPGLTPGVAKRLEDSLPPVPAQGQLIHLTRGDELLKRLEAEAQGHSTVQWEGSVRIPNDARVSYQRVFAPETHARYAVWAQEARRNGTRVRSDFGAIPRSDDIERGSVTLAEAARLMAETGQPVVFRLKDGAGPRFIVVADPFETPLGTAFAFKDPGRTGIHYIGRTKLGELVDGPGVQLALRPDEAP